jgi:ubiquitin-protein ligase
MSGLTKIKEEYKKCKQSESLAILSISVCKIDKQDDYRWKASFVGPKKTGYEGGLFRLLITIPKDYPNNPPEIRFKYPVFHPNVQIYNENENRTDGYHICCDYMNSWKEDYSIEGALMAIYQLMIRPTPKYGYGNDARKLLEELNNDSKHEKYRAKCNEWVRKYSTVNNK